MRDVFPASPHEVTVWYGPASDCTPRSLLRTLRYSHFNCLAFLNDEMCSIRSQPGMTITHDDAKKGKHTDISGNNEVLYVRYMMSM
jgi:hypothetical protein